MAIGFSAERSSHFSGHPTCTCRPRVHSLECLYPPIAAHHTLWRRRRSCPSTVRRPAVPLSPLPWQCRLPARAGAPSPRNRHPQRQTSRRSSARSTSRSTPATRASTRRSGRRLGRHSPWTRPAAGAGRIPAGHRPVPEHLPDLQVTTEDVLVAGAKAAVRSTIRGTHEGELFGIPGTGQPIQFMAIDIHRLENGRSLKPGTLRIFSVCSSRSAPASSPSAPRPRRRPRNPDHADSTARPFEQVPHPRGRRSAVCTI